MLNILKHIRFFACLPICPVPKNIIHPPINKPYNFNFIVYNLAIYNKPTFHKTKVLNMNLYKRIYGWDLTGFLRCELEKEVNFSPNIYTSYSKFYFVQPKFGPNNRNFKSSLMECKLPASEML